MPRVVAAGVPRRMPLGRSGWIGIIGDDLLVAGDGDGIQGFLGDTPVDTETGDGIEHHQMVLRAAGDEVPHLPP